MEQDFNNIELRAAALRLTENELIELIADPPMAYVTYWRARKGITSLKAQVKVLRRVEALLDKLESERTNA